MGDDIKLFQAYVDPLDESLFRILIDGKLFDHRRELV